MELVNMENITNNPLGTALGIVVLIGTILIGGFIGKRLRPLVGYAASIGVIALLMYYSAQMRALSGIVSFSMFFLVGIFLGSGAKTNKYKTGEWPKAQPLPPTPVVVMPPPSPPPAPQPQTIIHYTDNRDQSIRVDNSVKITVGNLNRDSARELLGLPVHFTGQRLENAYEDKIRILDAQAQALPRNDARNRLLISQQEDLLEQAYELIKSEKA